MIPDVQTETVVQLSQDAQRRSEHEKRHTPAVRSSSGGIFPLHVANGSWTRDEAMGIAETVVDALSDDGWPVCPNGCHRATLNMYLDGEELVPAWGEWLVILDDGRLQHRRDGMTAFLCNGHILGHGFQQRSSCEIYTPPIPRSSAPISPHFQPSVPFSIRLDPYSVIGSVPVSARSTSGGYVHVHMTDDRMETIIRYPVEGYEWWRKDEILSEILSILRDRALACTNGCHICPVSMRLVGMERPRMSWLPWILRRGRRSWLPNTTAQLWASDNICRDSGLLLLEAGGVAPIDWDELTILPEVDLSPIN